MTTHRILTASIAIFLTSTAIQPTACAIDITWDTADTVDIQGGTGPWDNTTTNWTSDGGVTRGSWNNTNNAADTAVFSTTGGTVTLTNTINLGGLKFTTANAAYTITGQTLAFGSMQGSINTTAVDTSTATTIASALSGTAGVTIAAHGNLASGGGTPGRLIVSGDNNGLSGGIAITAGLVDFTTQNAAGTNALTLSNNAGLVHTSGALTLSNNINVASSGGTIRNWSSTGLNLTGVLSGSGNLNITDKGTTTLGSATGSGGTAISTAANTFTGKIIVNGGGLLGISGDEALGTVPSSFTADSIQLGAASTLMNMNSSTNGTSLANGFDITLNANRGITLLTGGGKLRVGYVKTFTVEGVISGVGSLTKTDGGTLVLNAANTYTGATVIEDGTLKAASLNRVSGGTASSSLGAPTTVANGTISIGTSAKAGILSYTGTGETTDRVINLAGTTFGATIDQSGDGLLKFTSDFTATGVGNKTLTLSGFGTGEISGAIVNGSGTSVTALTKSGGGTWTLSGTNTYTGTTTLSGGVLSFSNIGDATTGGNLGKSGTIAFNSGTLSYTGATASTSRNMTLSSGTGGTFEITQAATNFTITGTVSAGSATRQLTKTGPGTLTLAGAADNSSGRFIVNAGTLVLDKASASLVHSVGSAGNADYALVVNTGGTARLAGTGGEQIYYASSVQVNSGGVLDMNGRSEGFATLSDNGAGGVVTNTAASTTSTLTLGENNGSGAAAYNYTYSGVIENGSGTVALTKTGTGTQVLSGINTYTGPTTISGGTLLVEGSISGSPVTVNAGGTLGGSGVAGITTVNSGGTLAPGFAALTVGNTTFNGGTFALEITGTTAGAQYSQLHATGTFSLASDTPLTINLGFDPVDGVDKFTIVKNDFTGGVNTAGGLFSFAGTPLGEGAQFTVGSQMFTITYAGGDGNDVVVAAVPEPSAVVSLLGGIGMLLGLRRRKS